MPRVVRLLVFWLFILSAGCSSLAPLLTTPTPAPVQQTTSTPQPIATQAASSIDSPRILRVWLPPQFDPNAKTMSAVLLKQRFKDFESQHPGLKIEIRIKAEEGESGLLNSLSITSIAAPSALPDLISLPRPALEAAAQKGLLHPIDGLSVALHDPNWYEYARGLGHVQSTGYGLPFAGNALVFLQRPNLEGLNTWDDILASEATLVFAANDPKGLVGLSLYLSAGGKILNAQGLPTLDGTILTRVLSLIEAGVATGLFSPALANLSTDTEVLQSYRATHADMAITWAVNYNPSVDGTLKPLPGLDETSYSFATGWVWSLAGSNPENQQLAVELAEYLAADDFLSPWIVKSGYLPTRPTSVTNGDPVLSTILETAQPIPSNDVLLVLGPLMQEALTRVLNGEQVEAVARSVVEHLK